MNLLKFNIIKLSFFLVLGIASNQFLQLSIQHLLALNLGVFFIFYLVFYLSNKQLYPTNIFGYIAFLCCIRLGMLSHAVHQAKISPTHYSHSLPYNNSFQIAQLKITKKLKASKSFYKYEASVQQLNEEDTQGSILLYFKKEANPLEIDIDDELLINAKFQVVPSAKNPFQFDYAAYLENQGIYHQVFLDTTNYKVFESSSKTLKGYAANFRSSINDALSANHFTPDQLGVIDALLLGQRDTISEEIRTDYINAGAIHILAISGLHIGIILIIFQFLLSPLNYIKHGRYLKIILLVIILWSFAFIAGMSASVIRAVSMFTAFTIGINLKRISNTFNLLFISMFLLLLFKPSFLFEVGFQMSYAAVFAILWLQPKLDLLYSPKNILLKKLWQLTTVTLAAQLGVLPLSLFYFHQFPGLFFLSNLLIIPCLGLILGMGILVIFLALLKILPSFLAKSFQFSIDLLNRLVGWIANQERFLFQEISFDVLSMIGTYFFLTALVYYLSKPKAKRLIWVFVSILFIQIISIKNKYLLENENELVIIHKNRSSLLIDKEGAKAIAYHTMDSLNLIEEYNLKNYRIGKNIDAVTSKKLPNILSLKNETLFIIDSMGVYDIANLNQDYFLLSNSPKINLDRLLEQHQAKIILADGSNYNSFIKAWERSCIKNKIPFHYTGEKGAYIISY